MDANLSFGEAIEAAKKGKLIARQGWNGRGMFVFQRPADQLPVSMVVEKVKSLPDSVKEYFFRTERTEPIQFTAYLCMKTADESIVNGWLASQTDILADDWLILED